MIHYQLIKVTINISGLAEIIIKIIVPQYSLLYSIVTNHSLIFTLKFWLLLFYFLRIKQRFSTTFYLQTDSQTKRQNSAIETYFWLFVNF